jgi:DNA invertase Pin-like site-specific DNA recombinase
MSKFLDPPLVPRLGSRLKVLAICRISTIHQDEQSLYDQEALYRRLLDQQAGCEYDMKVLASQGSGECLDRKEHLQAICEVESDKFDLVITEDLGRICRRVHALLFCELCEDHNTRLIAINDHVDTGKEEWRLGSFFAVMRHEAYNKDTAKRIRRSQRNRFNQGGIFQFAIFGYIKAEGGKHENDVQKDPKAEPILKEWFRRLEDGATYSEIADWLNFQGVPPGPLSRQSFWTCAMVSRVTHNPLLKGLRVHNRVMSKRINKTGHHRSVKAPPEERLERWVPHLAFFDPNYYDRVVRLVDGRNCKFRRKGIDGKDHRASVSRKHTLWPGQHLVCGICGRPYHWSGVRGLSHMMCSGSVNYQCWNSVTLNGTVAAASLLAAIRNEIEGLPDFEDTFMAEIQEQLDILQRSTTTRRSELMEQRQNIEQQIRKVTAAIAELDGSRALLDKLRGLEADRDQIDKNLDDLHQEAAPILKLPTMQDIKHIAREAFEKFARDQEAGRLFRRLIPDLRTFPVRLIDGGAIVLRAKFTLLLAPLVNGPAVLRGRSELRREMVVDLFEQPQRAALRAQVVALRNSGITEKEVAKRLGITVTAAQRAASLDRLMRERKTTDPFVAVTEPPANYGKLRRHRHPRYKFMPPQDDTNRATG